MTLCIVLLQKEVNPVISALAEANIDVTALHNHFLGENPRIMYMHISAMGPAGDLARGIRRALRRGGIDILAVHNHMLDEDPRIFFLHYWGTGPAEKLAETVRAAFDEAKGPVQ
jgi:hypothetical protein